MWIVVWVKGLTGLVQNTALTLVLSTLDSINHWQGYLCAAWVLSRQFHTERSFYLNWFSKYPANPLISPYHLLNSLMLRGRNETGQNWMGTEPGEHTVLQGHDSLVFRFSHDGATRAPITSEGQDPNLLEDFWNESFWNFVPRISSYSFARLASDLFCKHSMIWLLSLDMPLCLHGDVFPWRVTHIKLFQVALSFRSLEDGYQRL